MVTIVKTMVLLLTALTLTQCAEDDQSIRGSLGTARVQGISRSDASRYRLPEGRRSTPLRYQSSEERAAYLAARREQAASRQAHLRNSSDSIANLLIPDALTSAAVRLDGTRVALGTGCLQMDLPLEETFSVRVSANACPEAGERLESSNTLEAKLITLPEFPQDRQTFGLYAGGTEIGRFEASRTFGLEDVNASPRVQKLLILLTELCSGRYANIEACQ